MSTKAREPKRDTLRALDEPEQVKSRFDPREFAASPPSATRQASASDLFSSYLRQRAIVQRMESPAPSKAPNENLENDSPPKEIPSATEDLESLDEEPEENLESLDEEPEEDLADLLDEFGRKEVKVGTQLHHVELRLLGSGLEIGIASEWTSINSIVVTLLAAAAQPGSEISGREADVKAIFDPVQKAKATEDTRRQWYLDAQRAAREARRGVSIKSRAWRTTVSDAREKASKARRSFTEATLKLVGKCKVAIQQAWEEFGEFLPAHLIPAAAVFQDRDFKGDIDNYTYHTGASDDPIPIMWYKAPSDYPIISYKGRNYAYDSAVDIGGTIFGIGAENDPAETRRFTLRKVAHNESRAGQKKFNDLFNNNGVIVGGKAAPALGDRGGFDGDHVKDLGFGGKDVEDNYWPLAAGINRRAFNGYNSRYIVNYLDSETFEGRSRAIGGLVGKYFVVKGFANGAVPAESGRPVCGTHVLA